MFPLLVSHGNMIPASQPQIPYCRISCMCVTGGHEVLVRKVWSKLNRQTHMNREVKMLGLSVQLES